MRKGFFPVFSMECPYPCGMSPATFWRTAGVSRLVSHSHQPAYAGRSPADGTRGHLPLHEGCHYVQVITASRLGVLMVPGPLDIRPRQLAAKGHQAGTIARTARKPAGRFRQPNGRRWADYWWANARIGRLRVPPTEVRAADLSQRQVNGFAEVRPASFVASAVMCGSQP